MRYPQTFYVILGLLTVAPKLSGYEMRKAVQQSIGFFWGESFGQIYPALKKLAAAGLIKPVGEGALGRKKRQEFEITVEGRGALKEWLALPFENDPPRNEFLLKMFFVSEAEEGVALKHVQDLNARNRRTLGLLDVIEASARKGDAPPQQRYWMMSLELGRAMTQAALEWGEKTEQGLSASR